MDIEKTTHQIYKHINIMLAGRAALDIVTGADIRHMAVVRKYTNILIEHTRANMYYEIMRIDDDDIDDVGDDHMDCTEVAAAVAHVRAITEDQHVGEVFFNLLLFYNIGM
jgi:hypothetical protein